MAGQPTVPNPTSIPSPGVPGIQSPPKTPAEFEQIIKDLESRLAELEAKKSGSHSGGEIGSGAEGEDDDEIKRLKKLLAEAKAGLNAAQGHNSTPGGAPGNVGQGSGDIQPPAPIQS